VKTLSAAAVAPIAALALGGCAAVPAGPTPAELLQKVQVARTRAEPESLAAYYSGRASEQEAMAVAQRQLAALTPI